MHENFLKIPEFELFEGVSRVLYSHLTLVAGYRFCLAG